jgi:lantibiotic modifying enzyme
MAQGYAGLALFFGYLDYSFPDEGWDRVARNHIELAVRATEKQPQISLGLFSGLSGLAFAASYLSRDGARYRSLIDRLESRLLPGAFDLSHSVLQTKLGLGVSDFDVISGLAGIGRYLLLRRENGKAAETLNRVLIALVHLAGEEGGLPRWYTPAQFLREETSIRLYPHGNLNCGLAHGAPGMLALLSLAEIAGERVASMSDAIVRVADWLSSHTVRDAWGINWPTAIPLTANRYAMKSSSNGADENSESAVYRNTRTAWCYGSPGVARALWLAGKATGKAEYQQVAVEAMAAVYRRPVAARRIDSPTFCHGVAGLLQITSRFARDTSLPLFSEATARLSEQIMTAYQPESLVGFLNIEPGGSRVELPGLLEGSAGVAMALLAACRSTDPAWDSLFLLS